MSLAYISSSVKQQGHVTRILDCMVDHWDEEMLVQELIEKKPDMVLMTLYEENSKEVLTFINMLQEAGYSGQILLEGIYVTLNPQLVLKSLINSHNVWCIRGEGEEVILDFIKEISKGNESPNIRGIAYMKQGNIYNTNYINIIDSLNNLPLPDRSVMDRIYNNQDVPVYVVSSRGCYGNCTFCILNNYYTALSGDNKNKKWRERSIPSVVDEIEALILRYPKTIIKFLDYNFMGLNPERSFQFAEEIKKRNLSFKFSIECRVNDIREDLLVALKEVGLVSIFLGIESGSQGALNRFRKEITVEQSQRAIDLVRKLKIGLKMGFILFDEFTTLSEVEENTEFLHKNHSCVFHAYRPLIVKKYSYNNREIKQPVIRDKKVRLIYEVIKETREKFLPYRDELEKYRKSAAKAGELHEKKLYSIIGRFIIFDKYAMKHLFLLCESNAFSPELVRSEMQNFTTEFLSEVQAEFGKIIK